MAGTLVRMNSKLVVLALLFFAHPAFGAWQARHPDDNLLPYILTSHALLALWTWLDVRAAQRTGSTQAWAVAPAVFGFIAMPVYMGVNRPAGTWKRWVPLSLLFFAACVAAYGWAFSAAFPRG